MSKEVDAFGWFCLKWVGGGGAAIFLGGYLVAMLGGSGLDAIGGNGREFAQDVLSWTKPVGICTACAGLGFWALASSASGAGTNNDH